MNDNNFKNLCLKVFYFCKILKNLENSRFIFWIREIFFFFVLKCTQKEYVHNLNRRWARCALKALFIKWVISNFFVFRYFDSPISFFNLCSSHSPQKVTFRAQNPKHFFYFQKTSRNFIGLLFATVRLLEEIWNFREKNWIRAGNFCVGIGYSKLMIPIALSRYPLWSNLTSGSIKNFTFPYLPFSCS